ncbi:MAG TPA: PAS domain S-box protein [Chloroflexota bacterium]|nr:PAS domain S-box protein [Chloroflexota bacterium]HUM67368.1 PAS domain S-box protein [Chloroflexota bacterium]
MTIGSDDLLLHILIVDDNYWQLNLHQHLLEKAGYHVTTAATAKTAWNSVSAHQPAIILLDRHLPDQDGTVLCQQIKTTYPDTLIIMLSGYSSGETDRISGLDAGADDYLIKPISPREMLARVQAAGRQWQQHIDLKASERKYRLLAENATDLIGRVNEEGQIQYMSPASRTLLDATPEEMINTSIYDWIHPDSQALVDEMGRLAYTEAGCPLFECQVRNKDGRYIWLETTMRVVPDQDDLIFIARDITHRKKYEDQLRLLSTALMSTANAVLITDRTGKIEWFNSAFTTLTGFAPGETLGKTPKILKSGRQSPAYYQQLWQTIESGEVWHGELINRRRNGQEYVEEMTITPLKNEAGDTTHFIAIKQDVTEEREAKKAIEESEARFRNLVENLPDMVVRYDEQGRHVYVSSNITAVSDRAVEEYLGKTYHDLDVPLDLADLWQQKIQMVLKTGQCVEDEFYYESKRGRFYLNWRLVPEYDTDGRITAVLGIARDLTEHRQHNAQITRLAALVEQATELQMVVDQDNRIIYANPYFTILTGQETKEIVGQPLQLLADMIDGNDLDGLVQNALTGEENWHGQLNLHFQDNTDLYVDTDIFPIDEPDQSGNSVGIVMRNVSEEVRSQQKQAAIARVASALRLANNHNEMLLITLYELQAIFQADGAALIQQDPITGNYILECAIGHPAFARGEWLSSLNGEHHALNAAEKAILLNDFSSRCESSMQEEMEPIQALASIQLQVLEQQFGAFWIGRKAVFQTQDAQLLTAVADITANALYRTALFDQVQQQAHDLSQRVEERTAALHIANTRLSNAMRSRDEFLANMSHELRTPLSSILLRTDLLQNTRYGHLNEKQARSVEIIRNSGQYLLSLINDILDVAKIDAGKLTLDLAKISVQEVAQSSLIMVQQQAQQKGISLSLEVAPDINEMEADPRRLKQILVNLLSNAVKFTPDKGQVCLSVRLEATLNAVTFVVFDTGIGIPADEIPTLFQPFVQLDSGLNRKYEGTGLGLTLVRQLVDLHGGGIEVDSMVNKGTQVTIRLPWKRKENMKNGNTKRLLPLNDSVAYTVVPRKRILLAEDNKEIIEALQDYLTDIGFDVTLARNGVEVLEKIGQVLPHLVLMDIHMPDMDGLQAIQRIRHNGIQTANIPIVALTALAMPGDRERCLQAGATAYLTKPFTLKDLTALVENMTSIADDSYQPQD